MNAFGKGGDPAIPGSRHDTIILGNGRGDAVISLAGSRTQSSSVMALMTR